MLLKLPKYIDSRSKADLIKKMRRICSIFLFLAVFSALVWDCSRPPSGNKITRIDQVLIEGRFEYLLQPIISGFILSDKDDRNRPNFTDFMHYDEALGRNLYRIRQRFLHMEIPILGENNFIDFYVKAYTDKDPFMKLNVFLNNTLISTSMVTDKIKRLRIRIDESLISSEERNFIRLSLFDVDKVLTKIEKESDKGSEFNFIISDFSIAGDDPLPKKYRYNYKRWVADRILVPAETKLVFNVDPDSNSYLLFSYHGLNLCRDNSAQEEKSIRVSGLYKNMTRKKELKKFSVYDQTKLKNILVPLKDYFEAVEIMYDSTSDRDAIAFGNIMVVPMVDKEKKTDVFSICVDTLRRDRLGVYGYNRDTSPNIDSFARDSTVYLNANSNSSWTYPSAFYHYFGQPPFEHNYEWGFNLLIPSDLNSAVESFQNNDYITIGIMGNPLLADYFGYSKGFDFFYENEIKDWVLGGNLTGEAIAFLDVLSDFNLFMNLWYADPHDPYNPPGLFDGSYLFKGSKSDYQDVNIVHKMIIEDPDNTAISNAVSLLSDQYDSAIQYVDSCIGKLLDFIKKKGIYDNSVIVIFADHGEEFYEHRNLKHGYSLFEESINVPLIFKYPDDKPAVNSMSNPVDITDIFPTIWDIIGIKRPEGYKLGQNLNKQDYGRLMIAATAASSPLKIMMKKDNKKYIRFFKEYNDRYDKFFQLENMEFEKVLNQYIYDKHPASMLFDLEKNPGERLSKTHDDAVDSYLKYFESLTENIEGRMLSKYYNVEYDEGQKEKGPGDIEDREVIDTLRSLGYIN